MTIVSHPSPNWNVRPDGVSISMVVIHYTGMISGAAALERLCDAKAEVSSHYMIDEDGTTYQLVEEEKRAWHAGVSHWRGVDNLNDVSIGIELVNPGHEFGYRMFPEAQIEALLELLKGITERYIIPTYNFIGHSDIAPDRKQDPGELFPWQKLTAAGFGLWSSASCSSEVKLLSYGDKGVQVTALKRQLAALGFSVPDSEHYDEMLENIITAFQRHWRPQGVNGIYDEGTAAILADLLKQIP